MKKIIYLFLVASLLIISCKFTSSVKNNDEDKKKAFTVTELFYGLLQSGDYEQLHHLFAKSSKFSDQEIGEMVDKIIAVSQERFGKIESRSLRSNETNVQEGSDSIGKYDIIYETVRQGRKYKETFTLSLVDGSVKIKDYFVTPIKGQ